jgi:hypothetical protein
MKQLLARGGLAAMTCIAVGLTAAPAAQAVDSTRAAGGTTSGAALRAAAGEVKTGTSCRPGRYAANYRITSAAQAPAVTHVSSYGISPGGSRKITKTSEFALQLKATASYEGSGTIGVSGVAKVLAKAEVTVKSSLAIEGSVTTRKNVSVTDTVSNPTGVNKIFVFYRGYTKVAGAFRYYFCKIYYLPGQNYGPAFVTYRTGKWRSYRVKGEGALRCGAGSDGNALAAAALRLGCR